MHMVSKRDLNSAELETMGTSKNPTTVMMANGEVDKFLHFIFTFYFKHMSSQDTVMSTEKSVTEVMLLEDTPLPVLSKTENTNKA